MKFHVPSIIKVWTKNKEPGLYGNKETGLFTIMWHKFISQYWKWGQDQVTHAWLTYTHHDQCSCLIYSYYCKKYSYTVKPVLRGHLWDKEKLAIPHSWLITGFVTRLTRRVSLVQQELLTLPQHQSSPPVFSGVRVTRSLVL